MVLSRREVPDVGEYVIATVVEIHDYGAYVTLDEFEGLRAYLPWSEIATKWVRNIRDVLREGEKIVVKVIRVDKAKKAVDVSLKKVTEQDKRKKFTWWKRYVKASKIVELVAQKLGKPLREAYEKVFWKLEDIYGDPMYALEEAVIRGREVLEKAGIPEEWIDSLLQEAGKHVSVKEVSIRTIIVAQSYDSDGVNKIRECLSEARRILESHGAKYRFYTAGPPRYVLEVYGSDYKTIEKLLEETLASLNSRGDCSQLILKIEREKK